MLSVCSILFKLKWDRYIQIWEHSVKSAAVLMYSTFIYIWYIFIYGTCNFHLFHTLVKSLGVNNSAYTKEKKLAVETWLYNWRCSWAGRHWKLICFNYYQAAYCFYGLCQVFLASRGSWLILWWIRGTNIANIVEYP